MGFLTRCKRPFLFAFLLHFCNMLFSFFLKTFLILFEKQQGVRLESYCKKMSHECAHYDARAGNGLSYVGRVLFESSGMRYYIH